MSNRLGENSPRGNRGSMHCLRNNESAPTRKGGGQRRLLHNVGEKRNKNSLLGPRTAYKGGPILNLHHLG